MNTNKIVAALAALVAVGSASAQTYKVGNQINIAGSTALANQSVPAIHAYATNNGYKMVASDKMDPTDTNNLTLANLQGTKIALWTKVDVSGTGSKAVYTTNAINLHLLGSEGGTLVTASKTAGTFLPLTATGKLAAGDAAAANGQGFTPAAACSVSANASITFSDVDQAVGRFNTAKTAPVKCVALTEVAKLAAINFAIVAPSNFPASNISDRQLQALALSSNGLPLSFFTGDTNSVGTVYLAGRDIDSGTRVLTLVESGIGALTGVNQYVWNSTTTNFDYSIAGSVNGVTYTAGNGGYFSGGDLCVAVGNANAKIAGKYLIGYTSSKDLISKGGATKALSYNGVQPYAPAGNGFQSSNNVIASGAYSLWSVGRLYKNTANAPKGTDKTVIDAAATAIANTITGTATADLGYGYTSLYDLAVKRASEGATIFTK